MKSLLLPLVFFGMLVAYSMQNDTSYPEHQERTLVIIKPDGVQRGLIGEVFKRCERKGLKLVTVKIIHATREQIAEQYSHYKLKHFFNIMLDYMTLGPIVTSVWEGFRAVDYMLQIKGNLTNPLAGTIRFEFCLSKSNSVMHSSCSVEDARKEIAVYFSDSEFIQWEWEHAKYIHRNLFSSFIEP